MWSSVARGADGQVKLVELDKMAELVELAASPSDVNSKGVPEDMVENEMKAEANELVELSVELVEAVEAVVFVAAASCASSSSIRRR